MVMRHDPRHICPCHPSRTFMSFPQHIHQSVLHTSISLAHINSSVCATYIHQSPAPHIVYPPNIDPCSPLPAPPRIHICPPHTVPHTFTSLSHRHVSVCCPAHSCLSPRRSVCHPTHLPVCLPDIRQCPRHCSSTEGPQWWEARDGHAARSTAGSPLPAPPHIHVCPPTHSPVCPTEIYQSAAPQIHVWGTFMSVPQTFSLPPHTSMNLSPRHSSDCPPDIHHPLSGLGFGVWGLGLGV